MMLCVTPTAKYSPIFVIVRPVEGIGFDVSPDPIHFVFVSDDVFVIVALPDTGYVMFLVDAIGNGGFV